MARPNCPTCKKECVVIGTRPDGADRVQYLGCRKCNYRAPGCETVPNCTGSNLSRDRSGRFAITR